MTKIKDKKKPYPFKSFYLTPDAKEQLDYLSKHYGINPSLVMRKLLNESYAVIRYINDKQV